MIMHHTGSVSIERKVEKKIIREAYGFPSGLFLCFTMHVFSVYKLMIEVNTGKLYI